MQIIIGNIAKAYKLIKNKILSQIPLIQDVFLYSQLCLELSQRYQRPGITPDNFSKTTRGFETLQNFPKSTRKP